MGTSLAGGVAGGFCSDGDVTPSVTGGPIRADAPIIAALAFTLTLPGTDRI